MRPDMVRVTPGDEAFIFLLSVLIAAGLWYLGCLLDTVITTIYQRKRFPDKRGFIMAGKRYGGGAKAAQQLDSSFTFELEGLRFDEEEVHEFTATRKVDTMLAGRFMSLPESEHGRVLRIIILLIGKTLDNKDGTPVQWAPVAAPRPKNAGESYEPKFRGPDGKLHPMAEADKFTDFNAGSSRRRWDALVNDDDFTVDIETLGDLVRDLIEVSAGRPTDG